MRAASLQAVRELRAPVGQHAVTDSQSLVPLFTDASDVVRRQAAITAGFVQDRAGVSALALLVTGDPSALVRKAAAWAIGQIGADVQGGAGTAALTAALNDSDPLVRSVANGALGRLK